MELVAIGKVIKPRGIKGEVKVYAYTDCMEHYCSVPFLWLGNSEEEAQKYKVVQARVFQKCFLFIFDGISDPESAFLLKQKFVFVPSAQRASMSENEVLATELMGSEVFRSDGKKLGVVVDFFHNGANGVCEVEFDSNFVKNEATTSGKNSFLFPTTKEVLIKIIKGKKQLIIAPLEGML